jgi:tRNA-specific 2-thiouridylase
LGKRVVVGLSGGVDSSVAAYLLKQQGYDVIAVFMINWHDKTGVLDADCPWDEDVLFAELVAKKIGIPFHVEDLSGPYKKRVIDYMFSEYEKGRTPNPDILCNREIKFDEFLRATQKFSPDFVATGHYCKKDELEAGGRIVYRLLAGDDPNKEQSYFLCQLSQEQLAKTLFPIGHLHKEEVRKIARQQKLASAEKKDSQGICFVGKVHLPDFLQQKLEPKEGNIFEIPADSPLYSEKKEDSLQMLSTPLKYRISDGTFAGKHNGAHFFTIGQRKGLQVGGKKEPLFVIATDVVKNRIFVGQGASHPGLFRKGLQVKRDEIHWIRDDLSMQPGEQRDYMVRIRYRQELEKARLHMEEDGMYIIFENPQRGIAAGQFAAWYNDGELIGSGVINR